MRGSAALVKKLPFFPTGVSLPAPSRPPGAMLSSKGERDACARGQGLGQAVAEEAAFAVAGDERGRVRQARGQVDARLLVQDQVRQRRAAAVLELVMALHIQDAAARMQVDAQVDRGQLRLRQLREAAVARFVGGAARIGGVRRAVIAGHLQFVPEQGAAAAKDQQAGAEGGQHRQRQVLARQRQAAAQLGVHAARPQHDRRRQQHQRHAAPVQFEHALAQQARGRSRSWSNSRAQGRSRTAAAHGRARGPAGPGRTRPGPPAPRSRGICGCTAPAPRSPAPPAARTAAAGS